MRPSVVILTLCAYSHEYAHKKKAERVRKMQYPTTSDVGYFVGYEHTGSATTAPSSSSRYATIKGFLVVNATAKYPTTRRRKSIVRFEESASTPCSWGAC